MKFRLRILSFMAFAIASLSFVSCASEESSSSTAIDGNCSITNMVLGTLRRTVTSTTASGKDTTYTVAVAGSLYRMYIDQLKQEIYNPDSLPQNTIISKVVFNSIVGDGTFFYRTKTGQDTLFSGKDSIDFTEPRYFTCYSTDGKQSKTYKVSVNVHKSQSEDISWTTVAESAEAFSGVTAQKLFALEGLLAVLAVKDGQPVVITASASSPAEWTCTSLSGITDLDPSQVQLFDGKLCAVSGGRLFTSADGVNWAAEDTEFCPEMLMGASKNEIYAIAGGCIYSSTDLRQWEKDQMADDAALLPVSNFASAWSEMAFNPNFNYAMACGTSLSGESVIWKKTVDLSGINTDPWVVYPQSDDLKYQYPAMDQSVIINYDSKLIYMGLIEDRLSNFFISTDAGRSWIPQTEGYNRPDGIEASSFSTAADADNYIWIITAPEGKVLRGRLNRLSYDKNQTVFVK